MGWNWDNKIFVSGYHQGILYMTHVITSSINNTLLIIYIKTTNLIHVNYRLTCFI